MNHHGSQQEEENGHGRGQDVQQGGVPGAAALTT